MSIFYFSCASLDIIYNLLAPEYFTGFESYGILLLRTYFTFFYPSLFNFIFYFSFDFYFYFGFYNCFWLNFYFDDLSLFLSLSCCYFNYLSFESFGTYTEMFFILDSLDFFTTYFFYEESSLDFYLIKFDIFISSLPFNDMLNLVAHYLVSAYIF